MKALLIAPLLALAGCASMGSSSNDPAVDLADAQVAVRTETNGDVIEEYRVAGSCAWSRSRLRAARPIT